MNVLARLCHSLTTDAKLLLTQTFILSHFYFCSVIWHYCSMRTLRKVEKLQYKALKFVYNDYIFICRSQKLARRPLMYTERQRCILVQVYTCLNHISPPFLHDMFNVKDLPHGLRNDSIVTLPKYNYIKHVNYSILYDAATLWSTLDKKNIVNAQ